MAYERGYKFIIGVANANSTPGFVNNLEFQLVRSLDAFSSVIKCHICSAIKEKYFAGIGTKLL